jgi:hypothetical protein
VTETTIGESFNQNTKLGLGKVSDVVRQRREACLDIGMVERSSGWGVWFRTTAKRVR